MILTDDYFNSQIEINFYVPESFKGKKGENFPEIPLEIKELVDKEWEEQIERLAIKLFVEKMKLK